MGWDTILTKEAEAQGKAGQGAGVDAGCETPCSPSRGLVLLTWPLCNGKAGWQQNTLSSRVPGFSTAGAKGYLLLCSGIFQKGAHERFPEAATIRESSGVAVISTQAHGWHQPILAIALAVSPQPVHLVLSPPQRLTDGLKPT